MITRGGFTKDGLLIAVGVGGFHLISRLCPSFGFLSYTHPFVNKLQVSPPLNGRFVLKLPECLENLMNFKQAR